MSRSSQLRDSRIPETIVLRLDPAASPKDGRAFVDRIEKILRHLNWRTHFFIVSDGSPQEMEFVRQITDALALFLLENRFVTFHVHPLIRIRRLPPLAGRGAMGQEAAYPNQRQGQHEDHPKKRRFSAPHANTPSTSPVATSRATPAAASPDTD